LEIPFVADTILQLTANDFEEAMDFLNFAFNMHDSHNFSEMLPSIYRPTDEHMANNFAIKKDGRIIAIVGMFPITWHVGGVPLRVTGIGGVSTHPDHRGSGLMTALMEHVVSLMKTQGYHLSWLGGQRQRYLYFGYERCGSMSVFTMNKRNIKHTLDGDPGIRFEPLASEAKDWLVKAKALHDAQPIHCHRPLEDFYRHCIGWHHKPFAALDNDGRMVGYLVTNKNSDFLPELLADNDDIAMQMIHAWVAHHCEGSATIDLPPLSRDLVHNLGRYCEQASVRSSGNWQVIDWIAVTDALMKTRRRNTPMADGSVVLAIEGYGAIQLQVSGDEAGCAAADGPPDLRCNAPTAMRLLFGPLAPSQVMPLPANAAPLEPWCPLPLTWPRQDGV
jgi:predicted N-acetyltransferase YhbS